jgi:dihydroxy-acid dehydratase
MQIRRWDKPRMHSRHVTKGPPRAPHRSYDHAMGLTRDEIDQPFVGIATVVPEVQRNPAFSNPSSI